MTSHSDIPTERLLLRLLPVEAVSATAGGDVGEVARLLGCTMPADWRDVQHLADLRLEQLKDDPWLSLSMREDLGLSSPDQRTGQMAHDFVQLASGDNSFFSMHWFSGYIFKEDSRSNP